MIAIALFTGLLAVVLVGNAALYAQLARHPLPRVRGRFEPPPEMLLRAFLAECAATLTCCASPLLSVLVRTPRRLPGRGTVVLFAERILPSTALWLLRNRLQGRGWTVVFGPRLGSDTEAAVARIEQRLPPDRSGTLVLIGHGCGGFLARAAARQLPTARVVTIGTAHRGTIAPATPERYRPGSAFLRELAEREEQSITETVAIYSDFDAWVVPSDAGYLKGAFNIEVRTVGHLSAILSKRIFNLIDENLPAD